MAEICTRSASSLEEDERKIKERVQASKLFTESEKLEGRCPVVYSASYNIGFLGLENLHPFDARKWEKVHSFLLASGKLSRSATVEPCEASTSDLLVVHDQSYLHSLNSSIKLAYILEVWLVALIPRWLLDWRVLKPMRYQTGGTVLAAQLALEQGWAINIGGGYHHASAQSGGGFCVYADISLALRFLFAMGKIGRAMVVDVDAHQGNGHARDFANDSRVYILDVYNPHIYPHDTEAKSFITRRVELSPRAKTDKAYLTLLERELGKALQEFNPDLVVYNAGTDSLEGDPLGQLSLSSQAIAQRDELVFTLVRNKPSPIVILTSGGYTRASARAIADSILNLNAKQLIALS